MISKEIYFHKVKITIVYFKNQQYCVYETYLYNTKETRKETKHIIATYYEPIIKTFKIILI